jgi:glycosyltransferase involved in cell wall biosynthesis
VRLLYIADGRSPIAVNWIRHFVERGHEVHLLTSFVANPQLDLASISVLPVAFSGLKSSESSKGLNQALGGVGRIRLRTAIRHWLGPYTLTSSAKKLNEIADRLRPDLIHAMRIPFEGMMAAQAYAAQANLQSPLLVSVWGNDFTLHGSATPKMRSVTRSTLERASALHVDCNRDLRLAGDWGFPPDCPAVVLPGAGGIMPEIFYTRQKVSEGGTIKVQGNVLEIPEESPVIVNPRGFRAYIRNDIFFKSIPLILDEHPDAIFLCPAMEGTRGAEEWVSRLRLSKSVRLLPKLSSNEMAEVYRRAQISVSPSEHDGTPNTLLESMACGSLPVAGDLESIKEWIQDGTNGLLVGTLNPAELADAVVKGLNHPDLIERARLANHEIITNRALRSDVMGRAEAFYQEIL